MRTKVSSKNILAVILVLSLFTCCSFKVETDISKKRNYHDSAGLFLKKAADNFKEIQSAIEECPDNQYEGLFFLLENMPERDLKSLSKEFILENLNLAYNILDSVKWGNQIPKDIFLNYILPYVSIHERRDNWRKDFQNKFLPLVKNLQTPGDALLKLNSEMWDIINVHYSTKRPKADQSPYESIEAGLASCTGLSILLIDACRSVGVPARFVGVPLWKDKSGNHSWVEIWDNGWHFIGAQEPGPLDKTWFEERAALADDSNWKYSIYATSFKKTNVIFPPLFDSTATYVYADIITGRYNKKIHEDSLISLAVRLYNHKNGERIKGKITVKKNDIVIKSGKSKDETHDLNDFLIFKLKPMQEYKIIAEAKELTIEKVVKTDSSKYQFCELLLNK